MGRVLTASGVVSPGFEAVSSDDERGRTGVASLMVVCADDEVMVRRHAAARHEVRVKRNAAAL